MSNVLISIISDYLQPNFLLIKELEQWYTHLIFVTTEDMEKKNKSVLLEEALKLPQNSIKRITVVEDNFAQIKTELIQANLSKDNNYIVNVTGGTKVMPLATYEFFRENHLDAQFYYIPVNKNIIKNLESGTEVSLKYRLTLNEYFTLNGLRLVTNNDFIYPESHARMLFNEFSQVHFDRRRHKKISNAQSLERPNDRTYYSGAWFEEYCYYRLKNELKLGDDYIGKQNRIFRGNSKQHDNEIDVMFILDNQLHIFECKVSLWGNVTATGIARESEKDCLDNYLYKLAAIAKDYGFKPNSYLYTLHHIKHSNSFNQASLFNLKKRMEILGIKAIADCSDFERKDPIFSTSEQVPFPTSDSNQIKKPTFQIELPEIKIKTIGKIDLSQISKK